MSSLAAVARATSLMVLGATSLFAQVDRRTAISRPIGPAPSSPSRAGATLELPLAAPANLTLTHDGASVSLHWSPAPGAMGYLVTRTSAFYGTIQQTPRPIGGTSFTDVSQQFDPRYLHTYRVSAVYPDGRMSAATITHLPAPARVATRWGALNASQSGWTTSWGGVPEATGYVVRYTMRLTNGLNAFWSVDTSVVVAAPGTTHVVYEHNGIKGFNGPVGIQSSAVSAVFADGARSPATAAP